MNTPHLIEIALLMLAAFLIGCLIGYFLRRMISADAPAPAASQSNAGASTSASAPAAAASSASTSSATTEKKEATPKPAAAKKAPAKSTASKPAAKKPAAKKPAAAKKTAAKSTAAKPAASKPAAAKPAAKKAPAKAAAGEGKPETLSAPRGGQKDDLKNIKGIGPKIEGILNGMGIYHFDQVASWGRKEVKWVDEELSFKGRIDREKWIAQAKKLAKDS